MIARPLSTRTARALVERYGGALGEEEARALAAAADARLLALDVAPSPALLARLRAAGAVVARPGGTTLLAVTRSMLERARDAAGRTDAADAAAIDALAGAVARASEGAPLLRMRERVLELRDEARVMGIVNVTPDSFYERVGSAGAALAAATAVAAAGAAFVDIGGQSYADGNPRVAPDEERTRVVPAIRAIAGAELGIAISVDTFTASVADAALAAGAHLINDCSGLSDPELPAVVARYGAGLVVMHLKGRLNVREPQRYRYADALAEIVEFLYERTERALAGGVARDAIAVDPGLEFGKEPETDLEILSRFEELRALGYPIVLASSRKSFISRIVGLPADRLLVPSLATAAVGIAAGARIVRAHDVAETVALAKMMAAVGSAADAGGTSNSTAAEAV